MNRRNFTKTIAAASIGSTATNFAFMMSANNSKEINLGGPIFQPFNNEEEWIGILKKLNYSAAYCPLKPGAGTDEIERYKKAAKEARIIISEVGAWSNPIDPDDNKRKAAIEKNIKSLQLADEIGANCCVNISGSRNPRKWAGPHPDNLTQDTFDLIVETIQKIIDAVKPKNTFYTLETMPWAYPDSVNSYVKLLKAINRKAFAVHLDPVNLITGPQVYFKNGELMKEAFQKLGPHIKSCHAKDILLLEEKLTPHLPEVRPGLGGINYKIFLEELAKLENIPLMMEHLKTAEEYQKAADYIRSVAKKNNIRM